MYFANFFAVSLSIFKKFSEFNLCLMIVKG